MRPSFRTSRPFRTLSVSQPNRYAKKITLTAPHLFSYLPFTIYRGMKLRNCVHRSVTTSQACHIPATLISVFAAYSWVLRFNLGDFKLSCCAGRLLFAIQVLRTWLPWDILSSNKKNRSEQNSNVVAPPQGTLKVQCLRNCAQLFSLFHWKTTKTSTF